MQERDAVCGRARCSLWRFRRSVWPKVEPHVSLSQASDVEMSAYNPRHNRAHHVLLYGTCNILQARGPVYKWSQACIVVTGNLFSCQCKWLYISSYFSYCHSFCRRRAQLRVCVCLIVCL